MNSSCGRSSAGPVRPATSNTKMSLDGVFPAMRNGIQMLRLRQGKSFRKNSTAEAIASFASRMGQRVSGLFMHQPARPRLRLVIPGPVIPSEVATEANRRLRSSGHRALGRTSCTYHAGVLTLRGRVPNFYLKQLAQELVAHMDDVGQINNCLTVANPIETSAAPRPGSPSAPAAHDI
jgi:BON domain